MTQPVEDHKDAAARTPKPRRAPRKSASVRVPARRRPAPEARVQPVQPDQPDQPDQPAMLAITAFAHLPPLHQDPDTSMVESLILHLMSEHHILEAMTMHPSEAHEVHDRLHDERVWAHARGDLRFRPGRAMSNLCRRHEQFARAMRAEPVHPTPRA